MVKDLETLWIGGEGGMEQDLVNQAGLDYRAIPAAGIHGVAMRKLPRNLIQLTRGLLASNQILSEFQPDVLFFTGGGPDHGHGQDRHGRKYGDFSSFRE